MYALRTAGDAVALVNRVFYCIDHEASITITYRTVGTNETVVRTVEPFDLSVKGHASIMLAMCRHCNKVKARRLDRILFYTPHFRSQRLIENRYT